MQANLARGNIQQLLTNVNTITRLSSALGTAKDTVVATPSQAIKHKCSSEHVPPPHSGTPSPHSRPARPRRRLLRYGCAPKCCTAAASTGSQHHHLQRSLCLPPARALPRRSWRPLAAAIRSPLRGGCDGGGSATVIANQCRIRATMEDVPPWMPSTTTTRAAVANRPFAESATPTG